MLRRLLEFFEKDEPSIKQIEWMDARKSMPYHANDLCHEEQVLIYCPNCRTHKPSIMVAKVCRHYGLFKTESQIFIPGKPSILYHRAATHWMPLPDIPDLSDFSGYEGLYLSPLMERSFREIM